MKKFLRENWFRLSLLVIIIVLIGGSFYWFEIKPLMLRRDCMEWMSPMLSETGDTETFNLIYNICVDAGGSHQVKEALKEELTN